MSKMDTAHPSCSHAQEPAAELHEIEGLQGVNVWGQCQEVLEEQALKELEIFAEANKATEQLAVAAAEDNGEQAQLAVKSLPVHVLDIGSYIKQQEELKKRQEYKRSLLVSDRSKIVADRISKLNVEKNRKRPVPAKDKNSKRKREDRDGEGQGEGIVVKRENASGSEYEPEECVSDSDNERNVRTTISKRKTASRQQCVDKVADDGNLECYQSRLDAYYEELNASGNVGDDITLEGNFKVPSTMWNNLYKYQQEGVRWLWRIHQQPSGGLLGDEMGLGKTVQMIVFLAALEHSKIISGRYRGLGPTIIVCPATVIHQWVQHFHQWAPELRVVVLHQSGTYLGDKCDLIKEVNKNKGVLITTYSGVLTYQETLIDLNWHYVILDEGHKIRNHSTKVCMTVKKLHTPHRVILTGSPMQNNLQELWSLIDFVNPGLLGSLAIFMEHLANPIIQGGFANATPMQEAAALSMATALKTLISPYLLRRTKNQVRDDIDLPNKSEQVLFCSLTDEQRDLYKGFLMSEHVNSILGKSNNKHWYTENHTKSNVFMAITTLRKICNHPELYLGSTDDDCLDDDLTITNPCKYKRSGKMIVVSALLKIWKKQGHRVLLFTQSRAMMGLFQAFLDEQHYKYLKMDGSTSIGSRQPLINTFNRDTSYDVFLLTTRVGGLGVNLTGANRVIIYDPDWNPATDTQARERAWRIGQCREVTVYRLISSGTIEEKMYQRQVWKQLLSNKVLIDPRTQKFFKTSDLYDLFSLQEQTETVNIFRNSRVNLQEKIDSKKREKLDGESITPHTFSQKKIEAMKRMAQQIAQSIGNGVEKEQTRIEKELAAQRRQKLDEKAKLKALTPVELLEFNRNRTTIATELAVNKLDDAEVNIDFGKALEITQNEVAKPRPKTKIEKNVATINLDANNRKEKHKKRKHKERIKIDASGTVDGEKIEGLVKREMRKKSKQTATSTRANSTSDDYVLGKLFSKKGISSALQHEEVVQSGYTDQNRIRIDCEVQRQRDEALQAVRRSRLESWRW